MNGIESEQHFRTVPTSVQILRRLALAINACTHTLPREVIRQPEDGLSRLEELAKKGYGSLILPIHFSKSDGPRVIATVFEDPVLGKREILLPEAIHQHRKWKGPVGKLIGVTICPIVTDNTRKFVKDNPSEATKFEEAIARNPTADLLRKYIDRALYVLGSGGVVIMFPQGGRCPSLTTISSATHTLLNQSNRREIEKIAILFLGLGIKGEEDYQKDGIDDVNLHKIYEVRVGRTLIKKELFEEAMEKNQSVDTVVLEELRKVVPPAYLTQTALT